MDDDEIIWPLPPADLALDSENVHVWAVSLQVTDEALDQLRQTLTAPERQRAAAFHFDRDRRRFIAGRGTLREILGCYLHAEGAAIALEYGSHGKPLLAGRFARSGLQFNLAHSAELAILAVARGRVVGVDLERMGTIDASPDLMAHFCSPREIAEFQTLAPGERDAAFFRLWTRKEAWLKAVGRGIGDSPGKVEVSFRRDEIPRLIQLPEDCGMPAHGWRLREISPAPGFLAALALPGEFPRLSCWKWPQTEYFAYAKN